MTMHKRATHCVECGKPIPFESEHVDTCGKRCASKQLRRDQARLCREYDAEARKVGTLPQVSTFSATTEEDGQ